MNEENNINNQETNDLEKTQVIPVQQESADNKEISEPEKVEQAVESVTVEEVKKNSENETNNQSAVNDQAVVQNLSNSETSTVDEVNIQNIVDNSGVEIAKDESVEEVKVKKEEVTYKDPSKLSTVLVILLFIGLFVFIFEMPKITEWWEGRKQTQEIDEIERQAKAIEEKNKQEEEEKKKQEEEAKKKQEEEENSTLTLTCKLTMPATEAAPYTINLIETFDYNNKTNKVSASSLTTKYTFTTQDATYNLVKTTCETYSTKYMEKAGYSMSCLSDDLTVTVGSKFDLTTFKEEKIGNETLESNAKLNDNIADIKTRLTTSGYTCE